VTFAAGMATEGMKPFCAIYSTFLQRAYDQVVHDVAIQRLPVRFALDRAGLVGADGATHAGSFDLAYLGCLPGVVLMAPSDEAELVHMVATAASIDDAPSAVRYPRGEGTGIALPAVAQVLPIGRGRLLREAQGRRRPRVAIAAFGAVLQAALQAADILDASVADMRFVKPLDEALLLQLAASHELLVTVEDNVRLGGAGSAVNELLAAHQRNVAVLNLGLPDRFVEHASRAEQLAECGLDSAGILRSVQKRLRARGASEHTQQRQGP
jgi:1-deoxy-D-xylulose-5-phosphate synthase